MVILEAFEQHVQSVHKLIKFDRIALNEIVQFTTEEVTCASNAMIEYLGHLEVHIRNISNAA